MSSAALAPQTRFMPWRDRKGRLSWLKSLTLLALWLPLAWLLWRFWTGDLGAKPVTEALHFTGLWSVRLLLITLTITPLRLITGWGKILQIRRMAGLGAFAYALLHLALYALDQNGDIGRIATEIVSRFYLTIGFVALAAMAVLAATSFDRAIRQLGAARWQTLHSLIYPLTALAIFHAFLQAKINVSEPVVLAGLFLALMGVRALRRRVAADPAGAGRAGHRCGRRRRPAGICVVCAGDEIARRPDRRRQSGLARAAAPGGGCAADCAGAATAETDPAKNSRPAVKSTQKKPRKTGAFSHSRRMLLSANRIRPRGSVPSASDTALRPDPECA